MECRVAGRAPPLTPPRKGEGIASLRALFREVVAIDILTQILGASSLELLSLEPPGWGATLLRGLVSSIEIACGAFGIGALIGIGGA